MRTFLRSDGRTYSILPPAPDLLGDIVIITWHGSRTSRNGGVKTYLAGSFAQAEKIEAGIVRKRLAHGYVEVAGNG